MRLRCTPVAVHLSILLAAGAWAQQSENSVLHAVPKPAAVVIDGALDDWDRSGQIEIFANYRTRNTYSAKVAAMHDAERFYLAVEWRDPTPLYNMVDANFEIGSGWKGDCLQLRLLTDLPMHLDCWYSTAASKPVINIQYGSFDGKNPMPMSKLNPFPHANAIGQGAEQAFARGADGKSYTQEIALPWRLITGGNVTVKETGARVSERSAYGVGERFHMGIELLWGGADGRTFPSHRYADLLKEGTSSREFFWVGERVWGPVVLEEKGNLALPVPDYESRMEAYRQKTEGPVKLAYTMPFDGYATLVIEDLQGRRVRNLIGMAARPKGNQVDFWDCSDENGALVPPGEYRLRGLCHQGIDPVYEASYGSPGVPPWDTGDGTGAWMSDHCAPRAVAAGGERIVLGSERGEAGYGVIGTTLDGRKLWGDRTLHGLHSLAADEDYAYLYLSSWDVKPALARLDIKTGKYAPFETAAGPELKVPLFPGVEKAPWVAGIAVGPQHLAVPMGSEVGAVRFLDKKTAAVVGELSVPKVGCLAYDGAGVLHVWSNGVVMRVVDGGLVPFITAGLPDWADAMAVGPDGSVFLTHRKAHQILVYGPDGRFVRAIGREGGRAARGAWQPDGLRNPQGIAVDAKGRLWVTEEDSSPKRVSVWAADGQLVCDFVGPTGYGGTGATADSADKTRVFGSGCEFRLDYAANRAVPVTALGEVAGQFLRVDGREYFMSKGGRLYLRTGDTLRCVAAIGNPGVKDLGGFKNIPLPEVPKGTHGYATQSFIWSDLNDDGQAQAEEVVNGSRWSGWEVMKYPVGTSGYFGSYWLDEGFNIRSLANESHGAYGGRPQMLVKTPLKGWTPGGAPIWDVASQVKLTEGTVTGGCLHIAADGFTVAGAPLAGVRDDGTVVWTYKDNWHGVHGSHNAPIPERDDLLVGTLGTVGRVKTPLGTVFGMHSNMGRLYLMTTDGLFVASVFQDCRLGGEPWPGQARPGAPLGGVTMGSEWFGGHLFQAEKTGETYLIAGFTAYNLIRLNGIETLQAVPGSGVKVTGADVLAAEELARQRLARAAAARSLTIAAMAAPPTVDGKLDEFAKDGFVQWASGPYKARAALAADATNLYLAYEVSGDSNPMVNGGKDVNGLFATGDSVDLQLGTNAAADPQRKEPVPGDLRLLLSVFDGKPVAVLYRWKTDGEKAPVTFTCPWRSHTVDRVEVLADAVVSITRRGGAYTVEAAIPLARLGFRPEAGKEYRLDLGVIYSDAKGDNRAARVYWANQATGLVADIPGEIMATPQMWGTATWTP